MEQQYTLQANSDDYYAVKVIEEETGLQEKAALTALIEVGFYNILIYPSGIPKVDNILKEEKWQRVVGRFKATFPL